MSNPRRSLVAAFACGCLAGCSDPSSSEAMARLEARVSKQEAEVHRIDQETARRLDALAVQVEALALTLESAVGSKVDGELGTRMPGVGTKSGAGSANVVSASSHPLNAPANPAQELEVQRRTWIWVAALTGTVLSAIGAVRFRARGKQQPDDSRPHDLDVGAWDEASVLTEAVHERRSSANTAAPSVTRGTSGPDLIALERSVDRAQKPSLDSSAVAVAAAESRVAESSPARIAILVEATSPALAQASLESYLRHDPRVLQKPEPTVRVRDGGLAVECALLPGLSPGEKEHLRAVLQRLASTR